MQVAQSLYENGHITYMRTDSTNLAPVAIEDARRLVAEEYGDEYLPAEPRVYQIEGQERPGGARGAFGPAGHPFELPEALRGRAGRRRVQAVRPDLEADDRQPDGRLPAAGGSRSRSKATAACSRSAARRSTSPATCGRTSKAATIRRPSWPTRRRCCRASTWARRSSASR